MEDLQARPEDEEGNSWERMEDDEGNSGERLGFYDRNKERGGNK